MILSRQRRRVYATNWKESYTLSVGKIKLADSLSGSCNFLFGGYLQGMLEFFRLQPSDQRTVAIVLAVATVLLCWHTARGKQEAFEPKPYKFRIDLNTATLGELQTLPGIGPKLSERIIQYREQHESFRDFDEILNVSGIGPKRHSAIKPYFVD